MNLLQTAWNQLLNLLYPPLCPLCQRLLEQTSDKICPACAAVLPVTSPEHSIQYGSDFICCVSPLFYRDSVRDSFLRYKFQGRRHYALLYGSWMAERCGALTDQPFDCVAWVPLSHQRLKHRGYDQAYLLAKEVAHCLSVPLEPLLVRTSHAPALSGTKGGAAVRKAVIHHAFSLRRSCCTAGRRILLVDDIITTGATLNEAARILRNAGASAVFCVTLARSSQLID